MPLYRVVAQRLWEQAGGLQVLGGASGDEPCTGITALGLSNNYLRDIPAGVFDPLTALTTIELHQNDLSSLPPRIFEKLTGLIGLSLSVNPGSASFKSIARAGPDGGIEVISGGAVTLGDPDAAEGYEDPWGTNVTRAWTRRAGTERGAALSLTQTVGASSAAGADALLSRATLDGLAADATADELKSRRLELKLGYGLGAFGDRFTFTPEAGIGLISANLL